MTIPAPSHNRIEPGSVNVPVGKFPAASPSTSKPNHAFDADSIATTLVNNFNSLLTEKDYTSLVDTLFHDDSYWRDHLCLSWDFRTVHGKADIAQYLAQSKLVSVDIDRTDPGRAPHVAPVDELNGIEFSTNVETEIGAGAGIVRVVQLDGEWRFFTYFTSLRELKGHEEGLNARRAKGVEHGQRLENFNWKDRRTSEGKYEDKDPAVIIIGAGQAGLTAAARLKMLGVDTLIIDKEADVGDSWRKRYYQLVLHDPVWFDHMPYIPFPAHWPIFTPKDKLAEFFECYVKMLELNVWTKTNLTSASWSDENREWTASLERTNADGSVETRALHPRHVIQATGHSGKKNQPTFPGTETFQGDRLCHSSEFPGANPDSGAAGKKAVVVGSCNSGHDIAQDYYEKGYETTMVQRSSTCVVSSDALVDIGLKGLYEENGPSADDADLQLWSYPTTLFKALQVKTTKLMNQQDAPILEGLAKAGFEVDRGPDDSGLLMKYLQRGGGYYIDVGASQMIADGKIKIKQGQEITEILPRGIRFADGAVLEADEIVFATGYQNMRTQARLIFGDEVADRIGDIWGYDEEGEMRTIWRRSGHPGFWFMGGNLALCRYYSRLLALQIKAVEEGLS